MEQIELVNVSDLRLRLGQILEGLEEKNALVLKHGKPIGVLLSHNRFKSIMSTLEDLEDRLAIMESDAEPDELKVSWEKVKAEAGLMATPAEEHGDGTAN